MKKLSKVMGKVAKRINERSQGLYKLTEQDVINIQVALRLRVESYNENEDYKGAQRYRRTLRKFV